VKREKGNMIVYHFTIMSLMNTKELEKLVSKYEGYLLSVGELGIEAVELLSVRDKIEEYLIEGYDIIPIHILAEIMQLDLIFKEEFEIFRKEFSQEEVAHFQRSVKKSATHWWWNLLMAHWQEEIGLGTTDFMDERGIYSR